MKYFSIILFLFLGSCPVFASDIVVEFQQPSYIVDKENIQVLDGTTLTCDNSKEECKVNFDYRASLDGGAKNYECMSNFGFVTGEEAKCNPNTIIFPLGEQRVEISIKNIKNGENRNISFNVISNEKVITTQKKTQKNKEEEEKVSNLIVLDDNKGVNLQEETKASNDVGEIISSNYQKGFGNYSFFFIIIFTLTMLNLLKWKKLIL